MKKRKILEHVDMMSADVSDIGETVYTHNQRLEALEGAIATLTAMIESLRQPGEQWQAMPGDPVRDAVRRVAAKHEGDDETPLPCPTCKITPNSDSMRIWCDNRNCSDATAVYGRTHAARLRRWNAAARAAQSTWGAP
jgi:hypothetical protein